MIRYPIERASTSEEILVHSWNRWRIASWRDDKYAQKPRPYWHLHGLSITQSRERQPKWFVPLPIDPDCLPEVPAY